jgi:hypothetical protein
MGSGLTTLLPSVPQTEDDDEVGDNPLEKNEKEKKKGKKGKKGDEPKDKKMIVIDDGPKGKKKGKEKDDVLVMDERLYYVIIKMLSLSLSLSSCFGFI